MSDLINRQDAIDALWELQRELQMMDLNNGKVISGIQYSIKKIENVQPASQQKTGHWREVDTNIYACSNCNHCFSIVPEDNSIEEYKYCPNCKTKMDLKECEGRK